MTGRTLTPGQRKVVEIIEALGFGTIQELSIRDGQPCYDPAPRIVQEIKLGSPPKRPRASSDTDSLKKEFVHLFDYLSDLRRGAVDIEVQHGLPFKLIVQRSCEGCA